MAKTKIVSKNAYRRRLKAKGYYGNIYIIRHEPFQYLEKQA